MKKGFTLIELMIVIVVCGILMGTLLPRLEAAKERAKENKSSILSEECFIEEHEWSDAFKLQATRRTYFNCEDFKAL